MRTGRLSVLLVFLACLLAPQGAVCWEEETHRMLSELVVKYLPEQYRKVAKVESESYMLGVLDEEEQFPGAGEEAEYDAKLFGTKGMQRVMEAVRRLDYLQRKKAPGGQTAYQMGRLNRLLEDYLEPLPGPDAKFSALETTGSRIFFLADVAERVEDFDFLFDGYDELRVLPSAVEEILEKNRVEGDAVYRAYRRGDGFGAAREPVEKSVNRTLNLMVDIYYTLARAEAHKPLDLERFLGLKRFRGGGKTESVDIEQPDAPEPPVPPTAPPPEEEEEENED